MREVSTRNRKRDEDQQDLAVTCLLSGSIISSADPTAVVMLLSALLSVRTCNASLRHRLAAFCIESMLASVTNGSERGSLVNARKSLAEASGS